ncbi:LacI family transcriptional regulator [Collinsella sp. zg1085]|uniref:LacI family DNA-binding transcriptional regulator n=1 Tax=Collinsella sp. zg1085 TaxID=2844380 RepID=UPI001C0A9CCD|nr:LacI family DNA-binding transcriptional regulator [Collinsella sp. zg1085]QWT17487.1 LacI family transcriptional regulator [Collinsella sp. zg1085]
MARPTIQDVAREAGVALGTVSNVLNHPNRVRSSTKKRVQNAMETLGFTPNQSARLLAGGESTMLGLVVPRLTHGYSLQIVSGVQREAERYGHHVWIANAADDVAAMAVCIQQFLSAQVAGLVIQSFDGHPLRNMAVPSRTALSCMDVQGSEPGYFAVADSQAEGTLVAEHLIAAGARHIAVLGISKHRAHQDRAQGIASVAQQSLEVHFEFIEEGDWCSASDGYELGERLAARQKSERPDALLALSDVLAVGAIAGVQAAGLQVPDDMLVAGCDGNPLAWTGGVPLTTVVPSGYEVGRRAVQQIMEQFDLAKLGELTGEPAPRVVDVHQAIVRPFLLPRESTGAMQKHGAKPDLNVGAYL